MQTYSIENGGHSVPASTNQSNDVLIENKQSLSKQISLPVGTLCAYDNIWLINLSMNILNAFLIEYINIQKGMDFNDKFDRVCTADSAELPISQLWQRFLLEV